MLSLTQKREMENYLHSNAIKAARSEADIEFEDYDDVPLLVAKAVHDASDSGNNWEDLTGDKRAKKISQAKK